MLFPPEKKKVQNRSLLEDCQQIGGNLNNRPINISKRGPITYYSINFSLHSNFYFFDAEKTTDDFIEVMRQIFVPNDSVEGKLLICTIQCYN